MATRPSSFEGQEPGQQEPHHGPWAPKIEGKEIVSSGPLGSSLRGALGREVVVPPGKEYIDQILRRIPERLMPMVHTFLRSVPEGKSVEEAAVDLLEEVKALGHRIDQAKKPTEELRDCLEAVRRRLKKSIN